MDTMSIRCRIQIQLATKAQSLKYLSMVHFMNEDKGCIFDKHVHTVLELLQE